MNGKRKKTRICLICGYKYIDPSGKCPRCEIQAKSPFWGDEVEEKEIKNINRFELMDLE